MKTSFVIFCCLFFFSASANPIHEDEEETAIGNVTHGDGEHNGEHEVTILYQHALIQLFKKKCINDDNWKGWCK